MRVNKEGYDLDAQIQKMRLIVNGAVSIYEGQGLEIISLLKEQNRDDLLDVMDALATAMYWLQEELEIWDGTFNSK